MSKVRFTSAAEADLAEAFAWYDAQAPQAAARFLDEFEVLTARLGDNPRQFPDVGGGARRAGFRAFPYGLFFRIGSEGAEVFACFHASRDPRRWKDRPVKP